MKRIAGTRTVRHRPGRRGLVAAMAALAAAGLGAGQAAAQIANSATAGGSYQGAPVISNTSSVAVPLAPPRQVLAVSVSRTELDPAAAGNGKLGPGDTLTFVVGVRNDGNVTMRDVVPRLEALAFNGAAHNPQRLSRSAGEPAALVPGEAREFTFVYTLSAADIYGAAGVADGVSSAWTATGTGPAQQTEVAPASATATVEAAPELSIAKSYSFVTDNGVAGSADTGDVIAYTYVVTNTGNVALANVHVIDRHEPDEAHGETFDSSAYSGEPGDGPGQWRLSETRQAAFGANADANAGDAVFETLGVGGAVTFTFVHVVTQAEFDAQ